MPLLLLLIVAVSSGLAAAFLTRLYPRRTVAAPIVVTEKATGLALTLAVAAILLGGVVLALLTVVVRSTDVLAGLDTSAAEWGDRHATAWSHDSIALITGLGGTWAVLIAAVLVAAVEIARTRSRWVVPFLLAVIVGDTLLTEAIKALVDRARPELEAVAATLGPSFPSGHTSTAAASWAAFALIAGRWWGPRAWPALAGAAVGIAVAVGVSRVLLNVHWLTDVLAGLALGWAWFAICAIAFGGRVLGWPAWALR
jgi:undecaprenyl-diphosphatase